MARLKLTWLFCGVWLFVLLAPTSWAQASLRPELRDRFHQALIAQDNGQTVDAPFSLVVRGGISLGVYESGVNWAILRLMRDLADDPQSRYKPDLLAAAGASAGAINGFLAGLFWCSEAGVSTDQIDTLEHNIIRDAWQLSDIEALLARNETPLDEDRAAFSRAVLRQVQKEVLDEIDQRKFRAGCEVAFGLTLTRADPVVTSRASIDVEQQRLIIPLKMSGRSDQTLGFRNLDVPPPVFANPTADDLENRPFRASVIYLDAASDLDVTGARKVLDNDLDIGPIFDAVKASSAFPVAFAPKKLSYCIFKSEPLRLAGSRGLYAQSTPDDRCPTDYQRLTSYFVDGGVFDNDPLGLVRQLTQINQPGAKNVQFVKIDPDTRRAAANRVQFNLPPYGEPGDSLEIGLWAGSFAAGNAAKQRGPVNGHEFRDVSVHICRRYGDERACGDSDAPCRYEKEIVPVRLVESAPNSQFFIGSIHTQAAANTRGGNKNTALVPVEPDDRMLLLAEGESPDVSCAKLDTERETDRDKRRTIGIVKLGPAGLSTQLEFITGAVSSARGYRLYDELMRNDWRDGVYDSSGTGRPILQPTRLTTLTGEFLFAFGAFLDARFRQYDYYAGIYDAVFGVAELLCENTDDGKGKPACRAHAAKDVYLQLCAPGATDPMRACRDAHPEANTVVRQLVRLEVCGASSLVEDGLCSAAELGCSPQAPACTPGDWSWVDELIPATTSVASRELALVGAALQTTDAQVRGTDSSPFVRFIRVLAEKREDAFDREDDTLLGRMLSRPNGPVPAWYHPVTSVVIPDLIALQRDDNRIRARVGVKPARGSELFKPLLAVSGLVAESIGEDRIGWQWEQTSVPQSAPDLWRWSSILLPSELSVDVRNGGFAATWNPGWRVNNRFGIDLRLAPYRRNSLNGGSVEFSEVSALFQIRRRSALFSSFGIGPSWSHVWGDELGRSDNLGAVASAGLIADKLKITYGVRSFSDDEFPGFDNYLYVGLNDIPGIIYWLRQTR